MNDFLRQCMLIPIENLDTEEYKAAVWYMAKTELYDRSLTDERSPYDPTEAFVIYPPYKRLASVSYASELRKQIREYVNWEYVHNEIKKRPKYSAQKWVDEYYRLFYNKGEN